VPTLGKCPNCQNSGWFLKTERCDVCGKEGCAKCLIFLFDIIDVRGSSCDRWFGCSQKCINKLAVEIEDRISADEIDASNTTPPIHFFVERTVVDSKRLDPAIAEKISGGDELHVFFSQDKAPQDFQFMIDEQCDSVVEDPDNTLWKRIHQHALLIRAKHYETLREFENAAKIYKRLKMYEEAGRIRAKGQEVTVKRTDVSVNLNALVQQIRDGGIVAVYRCPNCGAKLKVDKETTVESLKKCKHCGEEIQAVEMASFLRAILS